MLVSFELILDYALIKNTNVPSPLEEIEKKIKSTVGDIQGISIATSFVQNDNNGIMDLSKINVSLYDSSHTLLKSKTITVKWANWNESNKKRLESKLNNLKLSSKEYYISAELDVSKNETSSPFVNDVAINHFNKLFNDSSIKCMLGANSGEWGKSDKNVFKYYFFINAENEEEYNEYIKNCKKASIYDTGKTAQYSDQLLTLSTCEYSQNDGRLAIVARKIEN